MTLRYTLQHDGGTMVAPDSWGVAVAPRVAAKPYRGKRVRLSAQVKFDQLGGSGTTTWLRLDESDQHGRLANGINPKDIRLKATQDFKVMSMVLDVHEEVNYLAFGVMLFGEGQVWIADVKLEEVGTDVPESPAIWY
jgi:hypothetical protein